MSIVSMLLLTLLEGAGSLYIDMVIMSYDALLSKIQRYHGVETTGKMC